jgi:hypothetical protein
MKTAISLTLLFCLIVGLHLAHGATVSNETDAYLVKIFNYAKVHDLQALEGLRKEIETLNNSTLAIAYALSLYMAAPEKYESQYVEKFPVDSSGIMRDLYENIELKRLTPRFLYSVEALGEIALKGNEKAIGKILTGVVHSDGAVSELFCDYTAKLFDKKLQSTVAALSRIDASERKGTYDCLKLMESKDVAALKKNVRKIKTDDQKVLQVIQEINRFSE